MNKGKQRTNFGADMCVFNIWLNNNIQKQLKVCHRGLGWNELNPFTVGDGLGLTWRESEMFFVLCCVENEKLKTMIMLLLCSDYLRIMGRMNGMEKVSSFCYGFQFMPAFNCLPFWAHEDPVINHLSPFMFNHCVDALQRRIQFAHHRQQFYIFHLLHPFAQNVSTPPHPTPILIILPVSTAERKKSKAFSSSSW